MTTELNKSQADDADTISTVVSIYDIGCMVGCLIAAGWGSALGRRRTIAIGMGIMVIGKTALSDV